MFLWKPCGLMLWFFGKSVSSVGVNTIRARHHVLVFSTVLEEILMAVAGKGFDIPFFYHVITISIKHIIV